jgi:hypothetical protein
VGIKNTLSFWVEIPILKISSEMSCRTIRLIIKRSALKLLNLKIKKSKIKLQLRISSRAAFKILLTVKTKITLIQLR